MRRILLLASPLVLLLILATVMWAYDRSRRDLIASGVSVGGMDVGGLHASAAQVRLRRALSAMAGDAIVVQRGRRRFRLTLRQARVRAKVDVVVQRAVQISRSGGILGRTARAVFGGGSPQNVPLPVSLNRGALARFLAHVTNTLDHPVRQATVGVDGSGELVSVRERAGVTVRRGALARRLRAALASPLARPVLQAPVRTVSPRVTSRMLAGRYPTYIVIDRPSFRLRLYKHLRLVHVYPIAVGQQGLETPPGLHHVLDKQVNPSWHVPNSSWAGSLAGQTIPPGPDDPLVARWMAIDDLGDGIHGTNEPDSIGSAASHGCIRMLSSDVIQLYRLTPMGTPVYVL